MRIVLAIIVCHFTLSSAKSSKYVISNEKVTFFQAFARCKQHNMDPVEVLSEKEELELEAALPAVTPGHQFGYWLFATNLGNDGNFVWLNSGKFLLYTKYNDYEPNNVNNSENCLEILNAGSNKKFRWNDTPCHLKLKFICQLRQRNCEFPNDGEGVLRK